MNSDAAPSGSQRPQAGRSGANRETTWSRKFRQAAFVYLHVGLLYEFTVFALWRQGAIPAERHVALWLLAGAAVVALVFWGLWGWQNPWFARAIWAIHSLRIPWLIQHAFFAAPPAAASAAVPPGFYLAALVIVLGNLWMLARAGWDL